MVIGKYVRGRQATSGHNTTTGGKMRRGVQASTGLNINARMIGREALQQVAVTLDAKDRTIVGFTLKRCHCGLEFYTSNADDIECSACAEMRKAGLL